MVREGDLCGPRLFTYRIATTHWVRGLGGMRIESGVARVRDFSGFLGRRRTYGIEAMKI